MGRKIIELCRGVGCVEVWIEAGLDWGHHS